MFNVVSKLHWQNKEGQDEPVSAMLFPQLAGLPAMYGRYIFLYHHKVSSHHSR